MDNVTDELGMTLHDRATRGEVLPVDERMLLETWYAQQDEIESAWLNPAMATVPNLGDLQAQVNHVLEQLTAVSQQIQQVMAENDHIRQDIAELQQQLIVRRSAWVYRNYYEYNGT